MKINSLTRVDDNSYVVQLENSSKTVLIHTSKKIKHPLSVEIVESIFSKYSQAQFTEIEKAKQYFQVNDSTYEVLPYKKPHEKNPFTFGVVKQSRVRNQIELKINKISHHLGAIEHQITIPHLETQPWMKDSKSVIISTNNYFTGEENISHFFEDPITKLSEHAFQHYIQNFSQQDITPKKHKDHFTIRELQGSPDTFVLVDETLSGNEENQYISNDHTVTLFRDMLYRQYGKEKVSLIEQQYGISLNALIGNNEPLTPEIVYRLNIGLGDIGKKDINRLLSTLKQASASQAMEQKQMPLLEFLKLIGKQLEIPLKLSNGLNSVLVSEGNAHPTVEDFEKWMESNHISKVKDYQELEPKVFNQLIQILSFTASESKLQYTGREIHKAIQSTYTIAGIEEYKPWIDQQELLQIFSSIKKNK